ncbi:MAG: hypothetical protein U9R47_10620 [Actinomycetota bacterium]|nr:hypothetical protein [Actinomycetota bacterium]
MGYQTRRSGTWLWLTIPIALLGAAASVAGILIDGTYERDTEHFAVQAVSQDYVTLLVAVPAVLLLGWLALRGSFSARLMWHGVVFYFAYTYTIAAFMLRFNSLFLVYTTLLACSVFALIGGLSSLGWPFDHSIFGESWPRRSVAAFLSTVVAVFSLLWLSDIVPALLDGVEPASLAESATPTNGIQVLDLSLLLPGGALVAYWVHRSESRGYVFATGLITYVALLGLALVAMIIGLSRAGLTADAAVSVIFIVATGVASMLLFAIVRSMPTGANAGSDQSQDSR